MDSFISYTKIIRHQIDFFRLLARSLSISLKFDGVRYGTLWFCVAWVLYEKKYCTWCIGQIVSSQSEKYSIENGHDKKAFRFYMQPIKFHFFALALDSKCIESSVYVQWTLDFCCIKIKCESNMKWTNLKFSRIDKQRFRASI